MNPVLFICACALLCACSSQSGSECIQSLDCGPIGEALCTAGTCVVFERNADFAAALVTARFSEPLYQAVVSANLYFVHSQSPHGANLSCEKMLSGLPPDPKKVNFLRKSPKYIQFNWSTANLEFPDIPVQSIRPSQQALALIYGYSQRLAQGEVVAMGCEPQLQLTEAHTTLFTIDIDKLDRSLSR